MAWSANTAAAAAAVPTPWPTAIGSAGPMTRPAVSNEQLLTKESLARFCGLIDERYISSDELLREYDFAHKYDENTSYSPRPTRLYKGQYRQYRAYLCKVDQEYYVVERRVIREVDQLAEYCECFHCSLSNFNPLRQHISTCPHRCQCLKVGYDNLQLLTRARFYQKNGRPIDQRTAIIRTCEYLLLLLIVWWMWWR